MTCRWCQRILAVILIELLIACSAATPPTELAPNGEVVQKAIALQLNQTEQRLSKNLIASSPKLEISKIIVTELKPLFIAQLPAYHLQGTYNLKFILPRQQVNQQNNRFDIYLQRQKEGKTWRLLKREVYRNNAGEKWRSYLIQ
ncbi:MAG: hypothetical protein F6K10_07540 [Moorea sp. SIO2B7]|nr:hypothetical protein [Moorena sp. SIO2B7]